MPNAFRDYRDAGSPDLSRARGASLADLAIGALAGILIWPFPVMRVVFTGLAGSQGAGWALHVPALLVFLLVAAWLADGLLVWLMRRTVGMYFSDLGFAEPLRAAAAFGIGLRWMLAGIASLSGSRRLAERVAHERMRSTAAAG